MNKWSTIGDGSAYILALKVNSN